MKKRPQSRRTLGSPSFSWWRARNGYEILERASGAADWLALTDNGMGWAPSSEWRRSAGDISEDYEPEDRDDGYGLWMVARAPWEETDEPWDRAIGYEPFEVVGLHRKFASLGSNPGRILDFANAYGFLGNVYFQVEDNNGRAYWGERTRDWIHEIITLQWLLLLWDASRENDGGRALDALVKVQDGKASVRTFGAASLIGDEVGWKIRPDILTSAPLTEPKRSQDLGLHAGFRALLRVNLDRHIARTCRPVVTLRKGGLLNYAPRHLLGAIYLQFLFEITGHSSASNQCPQCGKWFVPEHGRQIYCDTSCNLKSYRKRVKEKEQNGNEA